MNELHRNRFALFFIGIFYLLAIYKLLQGLWLFQVQPFYFVNRFDGTTWLLMQTGFHQWLLQNKTGWIIMDALFYSLPVIWYLTQRFNKKWGIYVAVTWLLTNWLYVQAYTLYPTNSIESYTAWLLMPILFCVSRIKSFYFLMHACRYFLLFFFVSAAIWKFRQGGIFNIDQMSGILLIQHKEYIVSAPDAWFSHFLSFLILHPALSYCFYLLATLLELAFIIGFFTRKYDNWLILALIIFLLADVFVMRIPYFEILPWALTLYFSNIPEPAKPR